MEQYRMASQTGAPVMRPLFYDFFDDPVAATVDDQLMVGPGNELANISFILVCRTPN